MLPRVAALLLLIPLFDELWSAVPAIDAPGIEHSYGLAHHGASVTLLALPMIVGAIIETRLLLLAERGDSRRWMAAGEVVLALAIAGAAIASAPWMLAVALGCAGAASGVASGIAESALVDADPDNRERTMTRWTLAAAIGDVLAPVLLAGTAAIGIGWRPTLLGIAAAMLVYAALLVRARIERAAVPADDDDEPPMRWRDAIRHRGLMAWLAATTACALLDEILVTFGALHLRLDRGVDEPTVALAAAVWASGSGVGLLATGRLLGRISPRRILVVAAIACTIAAATWCIVPSTALAIAGLFVVGLATAPLFPLCSAQAYAQLPGRATLVTAASEIFVVFDVAMPWLMGIAADAFGLVTALACVALGPAVILVVALRSRWR